MKKYLIKIIIVLALLAPLGVRANIICNDGSVSKTCGDCHQVCCSHHGGCASSTVSSSRYSSGIHYINDSETDDDLSSITVLAIVGIIGAIVYGAKKEKW